MKKYLTKPVLSVLAAVTIAGGLTPAVLAGADSLLRTSSANKVAMDDDYLKEQRYQLKELIESDPARLALLLKTQGDNLYLVIDELNIDVKLSTVIANYDEKWKQIYEDHLADIYLEVRYADDNADDDAVDDGQDNDGFVSLQHETKANTVYVSGKVTDDITRINLVTPNGTKIDVQPNSDNTFTVSFAAATSSASQYVTLKAYEGDTLVETEKLRVKAGTVVEKDVLLHSVAGYDSKKQEIKVQGIVKLEADEVYVTYGGEKKKATIKKMWDETGTFSVTFKADDDAREVLVEAYEDGEKIGSDKVSILNMKDPAVVKPVAYSMKAAASFSPKYKVVQVKGNIQAASKEKKEKLKLYVVAPDGKKQEVKLKGDWSFESSISYQNRSFSSKAVRLELYLDGKLVSQANVSYTLPAVTPPVQKKITFPVTPQDKDNGKDKDKDKGKGKGNWKQQDQPWKGKGNHQLSVDSEYLQLQLSVEHDRDDDDRDRDDDDRDDD